MRTFMDKVADDRLGARHTSLIVAVLEQSFDETFKTLADGGRTFALWVQYYYMFDVNKTFIRAERLADQNRSLPCTVTRMLNIFQLLGHHQYAKGVRTAVLSADEVTRNFT